MPETNAASNDSFADWARQYRTQKRLCEEANGVLRNIIKRAKSDGVNTGEMISAVKATKLDPAVVAANMRDQIRYMTVLHIPMSQDALFDWDTAVNQSTARQDDLWDASEKGYRAGRLGNKIEDVPYPAGSDLAEAWAADWHKGQAAIAREMGPDMKVANSSKARPGRKPRQETLAITDQTPISPAPVTAAALRGERAAPKALKMKDPKTPGAAASARARKRTSNGSTASH